MRGKLITIYGINNIGKSTHSKLLVKRLNEEGRKAVYLKYPVYDIGPTGPLLNSELRENGGQTMSEDELQLWFVMNRYQHRPELERLLEEGNIVVAEDYVGTGMAWGMAKGLPEDFLVMANRYLLKEDFAVLFEGERDLSAREENHVHEQDDELVKKCQAIFADLGNEFGWERVMVQEKVEDTAKLLWDLVSKMLSELD